MESFPYGDIVVIAVIAAFIILRYRAMLGEKHGRDVSGVRPIKPLEEYERIIQLPAREAKQAVRKQLEAQTRDYGALNDTFAAMRAIDREFSPEEFIEGARAAYEMVIDAYNKRDDETLRLLLAPKVYDNFKASLDGNAKVGHKSENTLIAIMKSDFVDAKLRGNTATIAVDFQSEQVQLMRDTAGTIVEGDPSQQLAIEDRWVFERDLTNSDPDWKIIET